MVRGDRDCESKLAHDLVSAHGTRQEICRADVIIDICWIPAAERARAGKGEMGDFVLMADTANRSVCKICKQIRDLCCPSFFAVCIASVLPVRMSIDSPDQSSDTRSLASGDEESDVALGLALQAIEGVTAIFFAQKEFALACRTVPLRAVCIPAWNPTVFREEKRVWVRTY